MGEGGHPGREGDTRLGGTAESCTWHSPSDVDVDNSANTGLSQRHGIDGIVLDDVVVRPTRMGINKAILIRCYVISRCFIGNMEPAQLCSKSYYIRASRPLAHR